MTGHHRPECEEMACENCPESATCKDSPVQTAYSSKRLHRVYIAGPLSGVPAEYLRNCGAMCETWRGVNQRGMVAFCPAADLLLGLWSGGVGCEPIPIESYQAWSREWIAVCDVVIVIGTHHDDGTPSGGVLAEIERATELGIPVVYSVEELCQLRGSEP